MSQRDILHRAYVNDQRMEFQQGVQTPGGEGKSRHYPRYRRTIKPDRAYSYSSRLTGSKPTRLPSSFTPFRKLQISDQESPFFTIPGSFQGKTSIQWKKQDFFQPQAEKVRPKDPGAVELGERST
ncbi:hypothetical protein O181_001655 [Austropuccinia psidii MF-1]|uniref:Uncharacterized protein n=1 Tax=Austropuccinia psidii MF-1 TaxID=1389203 RepID=A0A9Q3BBF4_9BASI|nr:hypothetical protein [Austropuccinia psidii MF-1]